MERLDLTTKQLAVDDAGTIEGIAWPYATADAVGDVIVKGAVRMTVPELPMLRNHATDDVIGIWTEIIEADDGLRVKGQLNLKGSMLARATRSQILTGRLNGLSIGFRDKRSTRTGRTHTLHEIDLVEVSVVREPSHPGARITGAKSYDKAAAIAEAINRATAALTKGR